MLQDVRTNGGIALGWFVTLSATTQGITTTIAYRQIKLVVIRQKLALMRHASMERSSAKNSTSECLTTFVIIAMTLYCPLAISYFLFSIQTMFKVIEPVTVLIIVISANSSGWANAVGYFYNLRIKSNRDKEKAEKFIMINSSTTTGSTVFSNGSGSA